jgi:hypothetical protein
MLVLITAIENLLVEKSLVQNLGGWSVVSVSQGLSRSLLSLIWRGCHPQERPAVRMFKGAIQPISICGRLQR